MSHISGKRKEAEQRSPSTCAVNMLNGVAFRVPSAEGAAEQSEAIHCSPFIIQVPGVGFF
jgi:hypothetical protein